MPKLRRRQVPVRDLQRISRPTGRSRRVSPPGSEKKCPPWAIIGGPWATRSHGGSSPRLWSSVMARPTLVPGVAQLLHGGDYNPDQWLTHPEILEQDARLLELSGLSLLSVGI